MNKQPELRERIAKINEQLREVRRMQQGFLALAQQIQTILEVATTTDWEERYVAEGSGELEAFANGEEWKP